MKFIAFVRYSTLIVFLLISDLANAQVKSFSFNETDLAIEKFEVVDVVFEIKDVIQKPFSVDFGAIFTGPTGEEMKVPGFYNGERQWVLRFSSNTAGRWKFTTYADVKALDGRKGQIEVVKGNSHKYGAIKICDNNGRKFCYEDGTPYMLQAFELDWLFALDYNNANATPKSDHMLRLLAKNGINQIVTTVYSYDINDKANDWERDELLKQFPEHEFGGIDGIYPFLGSNKNPDFSALNVTFFQQFDRMVSLMHKFDIVAHLMIYVWNKQVNWPEAETESDNMYFDYIIKRYQAFPNVIWDVSKEALNNKRCSENYGRERLSRIDSLDAYNRLATVHDYGFCDRNTDVVDFISIQTWTSTLYSKMLNVYQKFDKPVFNIEHGAYEVSSYKVFSGDYENQEICLRRNYLCYFAGAYATYYWQGTAWNVIVYNPFEQNEDFIQPKFGYYKHLQAFFSEIDFNRFEPYPQGNKSGYCLKSEDDKVYLHFIPKENYKLSIYGNTGIGKPTGTYQWFNTHTGEYTPETEYKAGHLKAPWSNVADAILIRKLN